MLLDNRTLEQIETSCSRVKMYDQMKTYKIDTASISADETVIRIRNLLKAIKR